MIDKNYILKVVGEGYPTAFTHNELRHGQLLHQEDRGETVLGTIGRPEKKRKKKETKRV